MIKLDRDGVIIRPCLMFLVVVNLLVVKVHDTWLQATALLHVGWRLAGWLAENS